MTERLGQTHSHLTVDELLDALRDPRFQVRYEAIVSIARMRPDPRLTAALIKVMRGKSPALSVISAWALGRLEALGPVFDEDPLLVELEHEGSIMRTRIEGRTAWCERRLLARIHRYTIEGLRREIEPVTPSEFLQFLACWQHVDDEHMLEGPRGVAQVLTDATGQAGEHDEQQHRADHARRPLG